MKKIKLIIWLIIIGLLGTIMYQNRDFFLAKQSLSINFISSQYQSPEIPAALFFAAFFLFGWLIAYLFSLAERFRAAKTIKGLQQSITIQQNAIDTMKKDVDALKPRLQPDGNPPAQPHTDADII